MVPTMVVNAEPAGPWRTSLPSRFPPAWSAVACTRLDPGRWGHDVKRSIGFSFDASGAVHRRGLIGTLRLPLEYVSARSRGGVKKLHTAVENALRPSTRSMVVGRTLDRDRADGTPTSRKGVEGRARGSSSRRHGGGGPRRCDPRRGGRCRRGRPIGRFVLRPEPGTGLSLDQRVVAVPFWRRQMYMTTGELGAMADVVFVAISVGFFGLCALYIKGCERILSSSEETAEIPSEVTSS
jgi:hypothetical protein